MRILIRADGDQQIGIGHVMRTLAIAERVVAAGGVATLAGARLDAPLAARLRRAGVQVAERAIEPGSAADAAWVIAEAASRMANWVVVDGYRFDAAYQEQLKSAGLRIVVVDDLGRCERYAAHVVVNQNIIAAQGLYPNQGGAQYLLGPKYALIRREFGECSAEAPRIPRRADRILVTLGGADPENAGARIIDAVAMLAEPAVRVRVVVGPSNPRRAMLTKRWADPRIEVLAPVEDMAPIMKWADLAVTGAGGTVYELACLGVPMLVAAIAEYQRDLAAALHREGLAVDLGWHAARDSSELSRVIRTVQEDASRRAGMSRCGRARVDGRGAERVLEVLRAGMPS